MCDKDLKAAYVAEQRAIIESDLVKEGLFEPNQQFDRIIGKIMDRAFGEIYEVAQMSNKNRARLTTYQKCGRCKNG